MNKNLPPDSLVNNSDKELALLGSSIEVIAQNFEYLMKLKGDDLKRIHENTGISLTNLNNIRKGLTNPTISTLESLAAHFGISINDFLNTQLSKQTHHSKRHILIEVPVLNLENLTGSQWQNLSSQNTLPIAVMAEKASEPRLMIKLGNNSMHPLYEKGTYFLVNLSLTMTDGDLVIIKLHDQLATIRRVFILGLQMKLFHPVLMKEQGTIIDKNDIECLSVIEKVIQEL